MSFLRFHLSFFLILAPAVILAAEVRLLSDFEDASSLRLWGKPDNADLVSEHATQGKQALKVTLSKGLTFPAPTQ